MQIKKDNKKGLAKLISLNSAGHKMRTRGIYFFIFASNEIREDDYDRWRYYYPKYITTKLWAKVPSQKFRDTLMDTFKSHPTN